MVFKNSKVLLILSALLLLLSPIWFSIALKLVFGILFTLYLALLWGFKGGVVGASFSSISFFLWSILSFEIALLHLLVVVLVLYVSGLAFGYSIDLMRKKATESLAIQKKSRDLLEFTSDWIFEVDRNGIFTYVNKTAEELIGYQREEIMGETLFLLLHPEEREKVERAFYRALHKREPFKLLKLTLLHKEGHIVYFEMNGRPVFDEDHLLVGYRGIGRDITESMILERIREEEYRRLVTVLDSMESLIYVSDMETYELLFVNRVARREWGEITGKKCWEVLQIDESGPCSFCTNKYLMDSEGNPTGLYQWTVKNARNNRWYYSQAQAIEWMDGRLVRLEEATDITSQKTIEEDLQKERARLANVIEGTDLGTWEWNLETGEIYLNEKWAQFIGYRLEEILPLSLDTWREYIHPDDRRACFSELERHLKGEIDQYSIEYRMKHREGHWVWILHRGRVIDHTQDGRPLQMFGTHLDITEFKWAEKSLKEKTAIIDSLLQSSPNLISIIDCNGKYLLLSQSAARVIGEEVEKIIGRYFHELLPADIAENFQQNIERLLTTKEPFSVIDRFILDGEEKYYETWLFSINENRIGGIADDITERRRTEEALKRSYEHFQELADSITDLFFAFDRELTYTYWNKASEELFGITADEAIGKNLFDLFPKTQEIMRAEKVYREVLRTHKYQMFTSRYTIGERMIYLEISVYPTKDGISVFAKDSTERIDAEKTIREYTEELKLRNLELEDLYAYLDSRLDRALKIH